MPLERALQDVEGAMEEARRLVDRARSEGVDVRQAERLLRQAEVAGGAGSPRTAARLVKAALESVRRSKERAALLEMAFNRLQADIRDLREKGLDTAVMESRLAQARAMKTRDIALAQERFAAAAQAVASGRKELADKKKGGLLKALGASK